MRPVALVLDPDQKTNLRTKRGNTLFGENSVFGRELRQFILSSSDGSSLGAEPSVSNGRLSNERYT